MPIWSAEIKELEKLCESFQGKLPDVEKELEPLIRTDDANVIMLYSRRTLEIIITDLCECEFKRSRGTEPLKGIIDKMKKKKKIHAHIIASMHSLNDMSNYGTHLKDIDHEQVKPILVNLDIILKWHLKYKHIKANRKSEAEEVKDEIKAPDTSDKAIDKEIQADIEERPGKNTINRRKFVKEVAGAAVCCACFSLDCLAASVEEEEDKIEDGKGKGHLAAVCGTYCGACPAYIAKHSGNEQIKMRLEKRISSGTMKALKTIPDAGWMDGILCDGCLSEGQIAFHCQSCSMKVCAANKQDVTRCSDCKELPCYRIANMINTGLLHRAEYLPNLKKICEMGVQEWIKYEQERWNCPRCGLPMSWYDAECPRCGEPRSEQLFPLTEK